MTADTAEGADWPSLDLCRNHHDLYTSQVDVLLSDGQAAARRLFARSAFSREQVTSEVHIRTAEAECGLLSEWPVG